MCRQKTSTPGDRTTIEERSSPVDDEGRYYDAPDGTPPLSISLCVKPSRLALLKVTSR
jgi:hypothetical protein